MTGVVMSGPRNSRIDLLRGVAISLVLLLHFHLAFGLHKSPLADWLSPSVVKMVASNGNYGVTMFFVISGFLITSASLQRYGSLAAVELRHFYLLRVARILPPLLLALAVIVVLGCLDVPNFNNADGERALPASFFWQAAGSVLTFWHNVLMQQVGWFNYALNVYWSLSVEEMFYLAFPLLCLLLKRNWLIVLAWSAFILIGPYYRNLHLDDELFFECGYWACFDAIALGCITALAARKIKLDSWCGKLAQALAALLLIWVYLSGIYGHEVFGFSWVGLATAVLLLGASGQPLPAWMMRSRGLKALRWQGRHSYELYLFHIIVLAGLRNLVPLDTLSPSGKLWLLVGFFVLSALVAGLVGRFYAEPLNRRLRNAFPQRSSALRLKTA